jgi:hypothetical protein
MVGHIFQNSAVILCIFLMYFFLSLQSNFLDIFKFVQKSFNFIRYTAHKMYFPFLHGEHMPKWKEHFVRAVYMRYCSFVLKLRVANIKITYKVYFL